MITKTDSIGFQIAIYSSLTLPLISLNKWIIDTCTPKIVLLSCFGCLSAILVELFGERDFIEIACCSFGVFFCSLLVEILALTMKQNLISPEKDYNKAVITCTSIK